MGFHGAPTRSTALTGDVGLFDEIIFSSLVIWATWQIMTGILEIRSARDRRVVCGLNHFFGDFGDVVE
jgi:hypothetical protein